MNEKWKNIHFDKIKMNNKNNEEEEEEKNYFKLNKTKLKW